MSSKRHERKRACVGKKAHATMGAAITAAGMLRARNPLEEFDAYHCGNCGKYHVGHRTQRVRKAMEERSC